jgi:hypothetical protein
MSFCGRASFLSKVVILTEFIKLDHTKGQVNLEILLSDESESDDSSVGASEAEEIAGFVSDDSELAVVTEDEENARGSVVNISCILHSNKFVCCNTVYTY